MISHFIAFHFTDIKRGDEYDQSSESRSKTKKLQAFGLDEVTTKPSR